MRSVKKNLIYQATYEILVILLPIVTSPYVARVLGAENIGIYSFSSSVVNYFILVALLGIKNYGNREISRVRDDKYKLSVTFSGILYIHFLISISVAIIYYFSVFFFVIPEYKMYYYLQGIYILASIVDITWFFFGIEEFRLTVIRNSVIKVISAASVFIFVKNKNDLWIYIALLAISNIVGQLYLWLYVFRYAEIVKVSILDALKHLPQLLILFFPTIAISLYNYMDKIMVGSIAGNQQLGFYENAEKIIFLSSSVIGSVGIVMLPRMSNIIAKGDINKRNRYIELSSKAVLCVSIAVAFGIAAVSNPFSVLFWGNEFAPCGSILRLLSIVLPIKGFATVLRTQFLIPSRYDKAYTFSVCLGALVNLMANYILIPTLGSNGAAIGTIFAEISVCLVQSIISSKELPIISYLKDSYIFCVFGLLMYVVVATLGVNLRISILSLLLQIAVGGGLFTLFIIIYALISKDDLLYQLIIGIKDKIH